MIIYIAIRKWKVGRRTLQNSVAYFNEHSRNFWICKNKEQDDPKAKVEYFTMESNMIFEGTYKNITSPLKKWRFN